MCIFVFTSVVLIHILTTLIVQVSAENTTKTTPSPAMESRTIEIPPAPYLVSLQRWFTNGSRNHFCGGTLISKKMVLTASVCAVKIAEKVKDYQHYAAIGDKTLHGPHMVYRKISKVKIYPNLHEYEIHMSISLIEVISDYPTNNNIKIISPEKEDIQNGTKCLISGWGTVKSCQEVKIGCKSSSSMETKNASVYNITEEDADSGERLVLMRNEPVCVADFGGPVVYGESLIGVLTVVKSCVLAGRGETNTEALVYTSVGPFKNWINDNKSKCCDRNADLILTLMLLISVTYFTILKQ